MRLGMSVAVLAFALLLACRDVTPPTPSALPPTVSPSARAVPSGFGPPPGIDRQQLIAQDIAQFVVRRVDRVTAKPYPGIWIVAIVGEIKPDALVDLPAVPCALFTHAASTGDVTSFQSGPPSLCDPYF